MTNTIGRWPRNCVFFYNIVCVIVSVVELIQNATIEERVSLLEIQVVDIEEDVTDLEVNLMELKEDVDFLFDDTVIQDERIFSLEQTTDAINAELLTVNDELDTVNSKVESQFVKYFHLKYKTIKVT